MRYFVDDNGYYGEFGGTFIPEMLYPNVKELCDRYLEILSEDDFRTEFETLLRDYVGRPTPFFLAKRLSEQHGSAIYLKREDLNHTGAHKINNALGQALLAKRLGKTRIIAETGAGQHGVATATACALLGLKCVVYMGEVDIERQRPNVGRMHLLGASVVPVKTGSRTLKDATNEALRDWICNPNDTHYIIGSAVGPHPFPDLVSRFQSVISDEIKFQLEEKTGKRHPTRVIACVGGGSNAIGAFYHFIEDEWVDLIGIEAAGHGVETAKTAATLTKGRPGVLHGMKTYILQDRDGQIQEAHSISAGLDYPGVGPQHAHLMMVGRVKYLSVTDQEAVLAAKELMRLEGIIPALESAHALAALKGISYRKDDVTVVCLSGRGDKDLGSYMEGE